MAGERATQAFQYICPTLLEAEAHHPSSWQCKQPGWSGDMLMSSSASAVPPFDLAGLSAFIHRSVPPLASSPRCRSAALSHGSPAKDGLVRRHWLYCPPFRDPCSPCPPPYHLLLLLLLLLRLLLSSSLWFICWLTVVAAFNLDSSAPYWDPQPSVVSHPSPTPSCRRQVSSFTCLVLGYKPSWFPLSEGSYSMQHQLLDWLPPAQITGRTTRCHPWSPLPPPPPAAPLAAQHGSTRSTHGLHRARA